MTVNARGLLLLLPVATLALGCAGDEPPCLGLGSGDYRVTLQSQVAEDSPLLAGEAGCEGYFEAGDTLTLSYDLLDEHGPGLPDRTSCRRPNLSLSSAPARFMDLAWAGGGVTSLGGLPGAAYAGGATFDDGGCKLVLSGGIYARARVFDPGPGFQHENDPADPALFWGIRVNTALLAGESTPECDAVLADWQSNSCVGLYPIAIERL